MGQANFPVLGPLKPQKHMIWCTYIGKTFCQVSTDHKLVNPTQKLQFGVMPLWLQKNLSGTKN